MIELRRYTSIDMPVWDACVRASRQGIFLFERAYMDYHAHRFDDHSLLVYKQGQVIAVLPAHVRDNALISHSGLSFGGIVSGTQVKLADMLEIVAALIAYCRTHAFTHLIYKPVPHIFHGVPAEDDVYALTLAGATLHTRAASLCINLASALAIPSRRMGGVKTAQARGVTVEQSQDFPRFWDILTERLHDAHGAEPVHTLEEIQSLHSRFPQHIRLYAALQDKQMIAGVLVYEYARTLRTQYIAADRVGRAVAAVDLIIYEVLTKLHQQTQLAYFDLGTSVRAQDDTVNAGLYAQKEKFGGRPILIDTYHLDMVTADVASLRMHLV